MQRGGRRDENGVVTADVADHFRPVAAIERKGYPLCGANRSPYHQQVGAGGMNIAQQCGNTGHLFDVVLVAIGQFVAGRRLYGAEFAQVAADA